MTAQPNRITKQPKKQYEIENAKIYSGIVLDRSTSMHSSKQAAIDAFNTIIRETKRRAGEIDTKVTILPFSTVVDKAIALHERAKFLRLIDETTYQPSGWTALRDAIGDMIHEFKRVPDYENPDASFFITIITDGEENSSSRFSEQEINELIEECEADGRWTFSFVGAEGIAKNAMHAYGFKGANTVTYTDNAEGYRDMGVMLSASVNNFFSAKTAGLKKCDDLYVGASTTNCSTLKDED